MSQTHSTKKSRYSHLSPSERGEISAYLKMGKKPAEIAHLLGRNRSTITREIKRGTVTQVQNKNGKQIYYQTYFADSGQRIYEENRKKSTYLKLEQCSPTFFEKLLAEHPITSITSDNGSEFSLLSDLEEVDIYFAHPYSYHERGTNENFNGLLREFLPKGQPFNSLTEKELAHYIEAINERPRRLHHYKTAKFLFGLAQTT